MDSLKHASFLKVSPKPHLAPLYIVTFLTKTRFKITNRVARIKNNDASQAHPPAPPRCCLGGL